MIFVLDGNALLNTLFHIAEAPDPPDIVERFLNRLEYLQEFGERAAAKFNESLSLTCAFDSRGPCFRNRIYPEYKANRPASDRSLLVYESVAHAKEALENSDTWRAYEAPNQFEADDLIASIAYQYHKTERVLIHGRDKDFNQCLVSGRVGIIKQSGVFDDFGDRRPSIHSVFANVRRLEVEKFTAADCYKKFGVHPWQWIDFQCLVGDSADNIKGAEGVGPKTAAKMLAVPRNLEDIDPTEYNKRIRTNWDSFLERLPTIRRLVWLRNDLILRKEKINVIASESFIG